MDDIFIKPDKCRKCGHDLEDQSWKSEWDADRHYKTNLCNQCGKKTWIKVDFEGSGHDHWKPPQEKDPQLLDSPKSPQDL